MCFKLTELCINWVSTWKRTLASCSLTFNKVGDVALCDVFVHVWAAIWQKPTKWLCAQQRLRSAWASAQSDQSLRCPHEGGCPGWSESSLGAKSFCWFWHDVAHIMCAISEGSVETACSPKRSLTISILFIWAGSINSKTETKELKTTHFNSCRTKWKTRNILCSKQKKFYLHR